jgi:hypothetical protein
MSPRAQYDLELFRILVTSGKTKNEIMDEMSIKTSTTFNSLLLRLMETDKKYYEVKDSKKFTAQKPLKVTIGKNKTLTLSSKILENSDFNSGDVFNLKVAKKKIILTLIEE